MQGKHRFCLCIQLLPCFIDRTKPDGRSRASVVIVIRVGFVVNYKCRTIALFAFLSLIHRLSCFTSSVLLTVGLDFFYFSIWPFVISHWLESRVKIKCKFNLILCWTFIPWSILWTNIFDLQISSILNLNSGLEIRFLIRDHSSITSACFWLFRPTHPATSA